MSKLQGSQHQEDGLDDSEPRGPNLTLIYSLMVVALMAAIAVAALVVLPFYHRR